MYQSFIIQNIIHSFLVIFIYVTLLFLLTLYKKNNSIADIGWGIGFILIAFTCLITLPYFGILQVIVTTLVTMWGLRLSFHIYKRNEGKLEDPRYTELRKQWENQFINSYLRIFLTQGVLMVIISLPVIFINSGFDQHISFFLILGILIWLFGFIFEAVGDYQLAAFIKDPNNKGKVCSDGLWKFTRHPNYFGEVTEWWGIYVIALSLPFGFLSIIGPATISFLILRVSGIPPLEKRHRDDKNYQEYRRKTSVFFPSLPRK